MEYCGATPSSATALAALAEPTQRWFRREFGTPTPAQCLAWPTLAAGKSLLLCAPTGSGKTLAAFLPIIGQLAQGPPSPTLRKTQCLYITPLKALGNDVLRNLRSYSQAIQPFVSEGAPLRLGLRTGDTSARTRKMLLAQPPDILLTTPESLAVLLSQPSASEWLDEVRCVIVDEIHALAGNKRGADLSLSLERLEAIARAPIQRIGLSATCAPVAVAAGFLVGLGRSCAVAQAPEKGPLHLTVEPLDENGPGFLTGLVQRLARELAGNGTTLLFTNVRSLAERLTWALRRRFPDWAEKIAVHHSSLSRVRRRLVETRLKSGDLRAVVSSTSLELGIDIGSVDAVVLVHPPGGAVRLLQRVGRAGHGPARVRRGLLLTSSASELLEATVTAAASHSGQCEPLHIPSHPLDVLCQQLLGMATQQTWSADEAFHCVRRAYPYRDLVRDDFDRCLDYLSGRHANGENWLPARLRWYGDSFSVINERTARILRRNVGSIIGEEARSVTLMKPRGTGPEERRSGGAREQKSGDVGEASSCPSDPLPIRPPASCAAVGQVDESFADRLRPGDRFLLDGRCFELRRCEGPTLMVDEVVGRPLVPRWGAEGWPLSPELARRVYTLRIRAAEALREGSFALAELLRCEYGSTPKAAGALIAYFHRQECISEIPDAQTCLIEAVTCAGGVDYYMHTPLSRRGNDALARVAALRLARERSWVVGSTVGDLGLALFTRAAAKLSPADFRNLFREEDFEGELTEAIAGSETLRERFRRVALTGLMVLRHPLGRPRRVGGVDWAQRRLFEKVRKTDPNFVLLRQAEREVREECCDAGAALGFLRDLPRLGVRCRVLSQVSPFAESWTQQGPGPVETVESPAEALERLHAHLVNSR
jgi:ATP-dependent Lhr-like helicase